MSPGAGGGTPAASDEDLVAAFLAGDGGAFDALVTRYERRVYAICYRYFGDATDAEDAMQEAFVALLRRGSTFTGASSFSTWMYRVATNACNDIARKRARRPQRHGADVGDLPDGGGAVAGVDDQLAADSLGPDLLAALRTLDEATREAIVLHDVYGLGYAEIADRSEVAVGTVKSRIHRGHARLAEALRRPMTEPSSPSAPPTL
jgi:RNA polymerase sigma-70 factor, ECF subfamily